MPSISIRVDRWAGSTFSDGFEDLETAGKHPSRSSCLTLFPSSLPVVGEIPMYISVGTDWKIFYVASLDVLHD